jgi:hypothetical protein
MPYFVDASQDSRESIKPVVRTLNVTDAAENQVVIGVAQNVGKTEENVRIWSLKIGDSKVPGLFVLVNGEFVQLEHAS